jgi:hypothetical protein
MTDSHTTGILHHLHSCGVAARYAATGGECSAIEITHDGEVYLLSDVDDPVVPRPDNASVLILDGDQPLLLLAAGEPVDIAEAVASCLRASS